MCYESARDAEHFDDRGVGGLMLDSDGARL